MFTGDILGGLAVHISGAALHDRWTWLYYVPDGTLYSGSCWMQIRGAGEEGNNTPYVALVTNCPTYPGQQWQVLETFPGGCPCTSGYLWTMAVPIAGYPPESEVGAWTAFVDYTDPGGVTTPGVAEDNMYLMYTPAVLVIHGWESSCVDEEGQEAGWVDPLVDNLREALAVTSDRVACFKEEGWNGYNVRKGVADNAVALANAVRAFRGGLGLPADTEVDLVAHSYGGLVARYYRQFLYDAVDGPIGSVSMLGTPNEGVNLAKLAKYLCDAPAKLGWLLCKPQRWMVGQLLDVDLGSDAVKDMAPGSKVLKRLNEGFELPESPQYRAHAGGNWSVPGIVISGSTSNDCVVSQDSVDGPGSGESALFGPPRLFVYNDLSHGAPIPGCGSASLINSVDVANDLVATIKGNPAGGAAAAEPVAPAQAGGPRGEAPMVTTWLDIVAPSESKTHVINVPPGLGQAGFVVYWLDAEVEPSLGVTLRRPDGSVVAPTDPDVLGEAVVTGDAFVNVLLHGFVMSAPQAGTWHVTVEGLSVPEEGQPYLVALMPDSQVVLSADTAEPSLPEGQPEVIRATLFDGATAIAATSASANVTTPAGTEEEVILRDDGTGGDEVAGDLTYSGAFTSTADCGGYSVLVTATGNSSEGTVTRQQFGFFQAQVPGDAVRDPCNPDDDEDLLTDADELNVLGTDPLEPDTDHDGMPDGYEVAHTCLNPLIDDAAADPDSDGVDNLTEYNLGTDPCAAAAVGGIAELPPFAGTSAQEAGAPAAGSGWSAGDSAALAGGLAAAVVATAGGLWYARRRWLR